MSMFIRVDIDDYHKVLSHAEWAVILDSAMKFLSVENASALHYVAPPSDAYVHLHFIPFINYVTGKRYERSALATKYEDLMAVPVPPTWRRWVEPDDDEPGLLWYTISLGMTNTYVSIEDGADFVEVSRQARESHFQELLKSFRIPTIRSVISTYEKAVPRGWQIDVTDDAVLVCSRLFSDDCVKVTLPESDLLTYESLTRAISTLIGATQACVSLGLSVDNVV